MKRIKISILCSLILCFIVVEPVWATTISDMKRQQQEAQDKLNSVNNQMDSIRDKKADIEGEIDELDSSLVETLASISMIEEEIIIKQDEIVVAQKDYDAAKEKEEMQYEAMKRRIQFMYEKGDMAYAELFLNARNLSEMLNKADYIEQLYEYDRKLLQEYQAIKQEVADLKEALEMEKDELQASQHELEEEKLALDKALTVKKSESKNFEVQLAKAKQEAEAYKTKIKQQAAKIKQLEAEQAKKNAATKKTGKIGRVDPSVITNATGSALGKEIATYAIKFAGNPYVPGGTSLTDGADCSGFTYAVYKAFGYRISRNSTDQRSIGTAVDYSQAQPGDIICYAGHVGLYIGGGQIIHASSVKTGIKVSYATYKPILSVRRVI